MTKLEKAAILLMLIGVAVSIFVNSLKLAFIISMACVAAGWICVICQQIKGRKHE